MKKIIAVFGGTFNPITNAHLVLAQQVIDEMNAEKVIFVPVGNQYEKKEIIDKEYRINMINLAIKKNKKFKISLIEAKSNILLKTIDTLNYIKMRYLDYEICFVLGTDNLKDMPNWHKIESLLNNFSFIIINRDGENMENIIDSIDLLKKYKSKFVELKSFRFDISSSYIRNLIKEDKSIQYLVPDEVCDYIKNKNLYK